VFSVFHPDAHDLFNTCSDLKKVAWELWDPERRLNDQVVYLFIVHSKMLTVASQDKSIQLFRAFAPMLCKRPTRNIEQSVKDMEGRTFFLEEKLDGERIQLHKRGNEYFYCSRSVLCHTEASSSEPVQGKERTTRIFTGAMLGQAV
jgi:DNA ligase-4